MEKHTLRVWDVYHDVPTPDGYITCVSLMEANENISTLEAELREVREDRDHLRKFFERMAFDTWGYSELDAGEFQDYAEEQGLLVLVPADEQFKAEYDADEMYAYSWSPLAVNAARKEKA